MTEKCPHCGASMKMYWHKITPGLVRALVKTYQTISSNGENKVAKDEIKLSHSEYGNFQKLRFHGLIAKYKVEGKWVRGTWLLTRRGAEFLKGRIEIPAKVQTFRNKVVGHDPRMVKVADVMDVQPYFESYENFSNQMEYMVLPEVDATSPEVVPPPKKKRRKNPCPNCSEGELKRKVVLDKIDNGVAVTHPELSCTKCDYVTEVV